MSTRKHFGAGMRQVRRSIEALPENDAVSPFRTPGTRLVWSSLDEWMAGAVDVLSRHCSAKAYRDQDAHLQELARHTGFVEAHDRGSLLALRAFLDQWYQPSRGTRSGSCYERLINVIHNQIARLDRAPETRTPFMWTEQEACR